MEAKIQEGFSELGIIPEEIRGNRILLKPNLFVQLLSKKTYSA
jgi:hypothetical protein